MAKGARAPGTVPCPVGKGERSEAARSVCQSGRVLQSRALPVAIPSAHQPPAHSWVNSSGVGAVLDKRQVGRGMRVASIYPWPGAQSIRDSLVMVA